MRSIPFKVIAILGLNDGQFPRQNVPMSFDLMSQSPRKPGDRSRRGDDRYLFLEALISARENLYLSYQGRDIHNNSEREPSLVLKELMHYLERGYAWTQRTELPLHPFSPTCYQGTQASFNPYWHRLIKPSVARDNLIELPPLALTEEPIELEDLVRFFDNPLKAFSGERLNLTFASDEAAIDNAEPFVAHGLSEYQIREMFCHCLLAGEPLEYTRCRYQLSGELPESPVTAVSLDTWAEEATRLSQAIQARGEIRTKLVVVTVGEVQVRAELPYLLDEATLLLWRPAKRKAKDDIRLWLMQLLATIDAQQSVQTHGIFFPLHKTKKARVIESVLLPDILPVDQAMQYFQHLLQVRKMGLCQPSLVHAQLGKALLQDADAHANFQDDEYQKTHRKNWHSAMEGNYVMPGLAADPYFHWFFPETPEWTDQIHQQLVDAYAPLYNLMTEIK